MNQRILMSLAAVPVLLVTAVARAQAPAAPPADAPPAAAPPAAGAPEPPAPPPAPPPPKPAAPPAATPGAVNKFALTVYGFMELDTWFDTTQAAGEGIGNQTLPRKGTVAGDNGRWVWSARNSRFGFRVNAPEWEGMKASGNIETDFGGGMSGGGVTAQQAAGGTLPYSNNYGNEAAFTLTGTLRLRHAYVKMETPYVDILAGQTWDLFGWGTVPTLAGGPEFQGITGQIFHRNPQLRFSHAFKTDAVWVEIGAAAVRPFQRDSQIPDGQAGLRVQLPGLKGVHVVGAGKPLYSPMTFAVSGMYRAFKLVDHPATALGPMDTAPITYTKKTGWGASFDTFLPLYGASMDDQSNALAITGEVALTAGASDMFGGLGGGFAPPPSALRAAVAGMPMAMPPVPAVTAVNYNQNFDNGVIAWDGADFVPIKWLTIAAGLQYHLPVYDGKLLWFTGNFGMAKLQDTAKYNLAPTAAMNPMGTSVATNVMKSNLYFDGTIFASLGPAAHLAVNYANYKMKYMDDTSSAVNHRVMVALYFFF
ncbi:MAG: hypothetical protein QOI66_1062 [Myxococcales bacterium]|jgi:hypothetical protein|nr:hypothetical protein [Myxococcales bacterium]